MVILCNVLVQTALKAYYYKKLTVYLQMKRNNVLKFLHIYKYRQIFVFIYTFLKKYAYEGEILKKLLKYSICTLMAVVLLLPTQVAFAAEYNDFDYITEHIDWSLGTDLIVTGPADDITTTASTYYITGISNPNYSLAVNGYTVSGRGDYGSFGVDVQLSSGKNTFTFTQPNGSSDTVVITRGASVVTVDDISKLEPSEHTAHRSGTNLELYCIAPYGSTVTASIAGKTINLLPVSAAQQGVPASYKGEVYLTAQTAQNLGAVTYTFKYNGETGSDTSDGDVYIYPQGETVHVQAYYTAVPIYSDADTMSSSDIVCVAREGAITDVAEWDDDRYRIPGIGWIAKNDTTPVLNVETQNNITGAFFSKTQYGERYMLNTSTNALVKSWQESDMLYIEMYETSGLTYLPTMQSDIFSSATVENTSYGSVKISFKLKQGEELWGHSVEYKDGLTTIYCKYPPEQTGGADNPLHDIIIYVDAGHGGYDTGALGTAKASGPNEKDINYDTAFALQKRLESLGATVYVTPQTDTQNDFNVRMQTAAEKKADFYISLHCNSVAGSGATANGVEVFYYFGRHKEYAETLTDNLAEYTNRTNRGEKFSNFRVTLNSLTPSVLMEMGFISNPQQYDDMLTKESVFNTVNSIADSIIESIPK